MSHSRARGEGKLGCLLSAAALLVVAALALKLVPVYYADSNLADYASEVAGEAGLNPIKTLEARLRREIRLGDRAWLRFRSDIRQSPVRYGDPHL